MVKPCINWAAIKDVRIFLRLITGKTGGKMYVNIGVVENTFNNVGITMLRNTLILTAIVIIIVIEAYRKALKNTGWQLRWL